MLRFCPIFRLLTSENSRNLDQNVPRAVVCFDILSYFEPFLKKYKNVHVKCKKNQIVDPELILYF